MERKYEVLFLENGNTFVGDEHGQQVSELQFPWLVEWIKEAEKRGFDPREMLLRLPKGRAARPVFLPAIDKEDIPRWSWEFIG